jgi:hypothetical protein
MKLMSLLHSVWHRLPHSSTDWSRARSLYSTRWSYAQRFIVAVYCSIWSAL